MSGKTKFASLLPYLESSSPLPRLVVSLRSSDPKELEGMSNPFILVDDSSAVGRLLQASFVTDAGAELKRVSLFVQRSQYRLPKDPLVPLTNKDIISLWQAGFQALLEDPGRSGLLLLSALTDEQTYLVPFRPLFLCKKKTVYFEPPCPHCGLPLEQCEDDELLRASGLSSFSSTLTRYLYCPSCHKKGQTTSFYLYDKENETSPLVMDRNELILEFSSLLDKPLNSTPFPCTNCDQKGVCFGSEGKATSRIAIFSFYPFFMLPFESATMHALDFLALVSGANQDEIVDTMNLSPNHARVARLQEVSERIQGELPYLFSKEQRFLELLYLKIVFLKQLITWLDQLPLNEMQPFFSFSLDNFWVNLPEIQGPLPMFWNFVVKPHGIMVAPQPEKPSIIALQYTNKSHFMGLVWFYVLLCNKEQGMKQILEQLKGLLSNSSPITPEKFIDFVKTKGLSDFSPENLFWKPSAHQVSKTHYPYWKACLQTGWKILRSAFAEPQQAPSPLLWISEIESLEKQIKEALLKATPSAEQQVPEKVTALDQEIAGILARIAEKWRSQIPQQAPPDAIQEGKEAIEAVSPLEAEPSIEMQAPPLEETIIISPQASQDTEAPLQQKATAEKPVTEEPEIPETVIFTTQKTPAATTEPHKPVQSTSSHRESETPPSNREDKEFEQTLSLLDQELGGMVDQPPQPSTQEPGPKAPEEKEEAEEEIPETIIIRPDKD